MKSLRGGLNGGMTSLGWTGQYGMEDEGYGAGVEENGSGELGRGTVSGGGWRRVSGSVRFRLY